MLLDCAANARKTRSRIRTLKSARCSIRRDCEILLESVSVRRGRGFVLVDGLLDVSEGVRFVRVAAAS